MTEHARTTSKFSGKVYQWCDTEGYMVIDKVTGPVQVRGSFLMSKEKALGYVDQPGWETRFAVVPVQYIGAFEVV